MGCLETISGKIPARYILCFMLFLGFMVTFLLRVNINLAIVAMVKSNTLFMNGNEQFTSADINECLINHKESNITLNTSKTIKVLQDEIGEFEWNEFQQGIILSSFFWGYLLFQIPGGRVAETWGPKTVFGLSILLNGFLNLSLPVAARIHWTLLLAVRALQGLGQGVVFPCLTASVARWVPIAERARFISFAIQGCSLGQVVALPLCGWILTELGWPAVFYISGILGLVWYIAWCFLVFDSPDDHPRISLKEKQFLQKHIPRVEISKMNSVPWLAILTSWQFWVGSIAANGSDWGFHTFCTYGPKYIKNSLGFDLEQSSWLSSLPFLSQYIFSLAYSTFCDWLLKLDVSIVKVRKLSVIVSHLFPALGLMTLSLTGCNVLLSVLILTLCVTFIGALSSGFFQNPLDIAPNFAGSLTGITNTIGALTAVVSTPLAGAILQSTGSKNAWHYIFFIAAGVYFLTSLPYLLFAKIKVEPWNDFSSTDRKEKRNFSLQKIAIDENDTSESKALTALTST